MNDQEAKQQMTRIAAYRELEAQRDKAYTALTKITEQWEHGPCGQGPFTGNTRESRQIHSMKIWFTQTRGGADAVDLEIPDMHIEAWEVGRMLESALREKIKRLNEAMEKV